MEYAWIQEEKILLLIVVESQHDSEITPIKILWDRRVKINSEYSFCFTTTKNGRPEVKLIEPQVNIDWAVVSPKGNEYKYNNGHSVHKVDTLNLPWANASRKSKLAITANNREITWGVPIIAWRKTEDG